MPSNRLIDVEELLEYYSVNIVNESNPEYIHCQCPFHEGSGRSPLNFGIHRKTGKWKCFAGCGGGDIIDFICKSEHCNREEAELKLEDDFSTKGLSFERIAKLLNEKKKTDSKVELVEKEMPCWLRPISANHPYIKFRGFDYESMTAQQAHVDPDDLSCIYFPVRFNGKLLGFSRKIITQGAKPSWIHDKSLPRSAILYGFDDAKDSDYVIVTEGPFDVLNLRRLGYTSVVATFGTEFSTAHVAHLIRNWSTVILAFDGDEPGRIASEKMEKRLVQYIPNLYVLSLPDKLDPGAIKTLEEAQTYMTNNIRRCGWQNQNKSWEQIAKTWG